MGKLQQQCAACSKENRRFSVDAPNDRIRAKDARRPAHGCGPNQRQLTFEIAFGDGA
jgi:hypothetical protein